MKKIGCIFLFNLVLHSCNNPPKSDSKSNVTLVGNYVNHYEKDVVHFVNLKNDSTYVHFYQKKGENSKESNGKWKLITNPNKNEILFYDWFDFGYIDEPTCNGCIRFVKIENGELIFSVDLPDELNFKK